MLLPNLSGVLAVLAEFFEQGLDAFAQGLQLRMARTVFPACRLQPCCGQLFEFLADCLMQIFGERGQLIQLVAR